MRKIQTGNITINLVERNQTTKAKVNISKEEFTKKLESFIKRDKEVSTKDKTTQDDELNQDLEDELNLLMLNLNGTILEKVNLNKLSIAIAKSVANGKSEALEKNIENFISEAQMIIENFTEEETLIFNKELMNQFIEIVDEKQITENDSENFQIKVANELDFQTQQNLLAKVSADEIKDNLINYIKQLVNNQEKDLESKNKIEANNLKDLRTEEVLVNKEIFLDLNMNNLKKNIESKNRAEVSALKDLSAKEFALSSNQTKEEFSVQKENLKELDIDKQELIENKVDHLKMSENETVSIVGKDLTIDEEKTIRSLNQQEETFKLAQKNEASNQPESVIKRVDQKDFTTQIESLFIDQIESSDSKEEITRARLQLTPEKLGKVDLKIEMQGKELVARIIVEQNETKEWVKQQLSFLKEQLLSQEIHVKDFQVVVHQENMHDDSLMDQQENPFFKQKQKETEEKRTRQGQNYSTTESIVQQNHHSAKRYSRTNGVSIFA